MISTFRLRVVNLGECMNSVRMAVSNKDPVSDRRNSVNYRFPGNSRIRSGRTAQALIPFKPDSYGLQPFRCSISFIRRGVVHTYETDDTVHTVYQQTDEPAQVINQVINNIENKGHAADVPVSSTVDFYRGMEQSASINQIMDKAGSAPSVWIPLSLYESDNGEGEKRIIPFGAPPEKAVTGRLSLQTPSFRIHLLSGDIVTMGRQREKGGGPANDIVTRICSGSDRVRAGRQRMLSRHHCHIRRDGDMVRVVDYGLTPEGEPVRNAWGTYISGEAVPAGEAFDLPMNDEFVLSLASPPDRRRRLLRPALPDPGMRSVEQLRSLPLSGPLRPDRSGRSDHAPVRRAQ